MTWKRKKIAFEQYKMRYRTMLAKKKRPKTIKYLKKKKSL